MLNQLNQLGLNITLLTGNSIPTQESSTERLSTQSAIFSIFYSTVTLNSDL